MKYKDHNDIDVIQFGTGDVSICELRDDKDLFAIGFHDTEPGEINRELLTGGLSDKEAGVFLKLVFTKPESIDVLINKLNTTKTDLIEYKEGNQCQSNA